MKRLITLILLAFSVFVGGCNQDDKVDGFVGQLDTVTDEVVKRAEAGSDRKAAIASAQSYLDENRSQIESAYKEMEDLRGFEVSEEAMKRLTDSVTDNTTKVMGLSLKFAGEAATDGALDKSLDKLTDDYTNMLGGG